MDARTLAFIFDLGIALWYLTLSIMFVTLLFKAQGQVTFHLPHARIVVALCILGTLLFFAGCSAHHMEMAVGLANADPMADGEMTRFMLVMNGVQFIGAPLALVASWYLVQDVKLFERN